MRFGKVFSAIIIFLALAACATSPKAHHPQPSDHLKAQAKHLYFAVLHALSEDGGAIPETYLADSVLFPTGEGEKPTALSRSQAAERIGESAKMNSVKENSLEIKTRAELEKTAEDCPLAFKIMRDCLKDGDILVSGEFEGSSAGTEDKCSRLYLAFRKVEGRIVLTAAMFL